jgi:hypothetical protein
MVDLKPNSCEYKWIGSVLAVSTFSFPRVRFLFPEYTFSAPKRQKHDYLEKVKRT